MTDISKSIKKLFQGESSLDELSTDISLIKVELSKESKVLNVFLKDSYSMTDNDREIVVSLFNKKFPDLLISCSFISTDEPLSEEELYLLSLQDP